MSGIVVWRAESRLACNSPKIKDYPFLRYLVLVSWIAVLFPAETGIKIVFFFVDVMNMSQFLFSLIISMT